MLHGNFFPVFGDNDDGFYGSPYRRPYGAHNYNPRTYEERRRRAELERYKQWKQQELLRQREEEALRKKRAQEEYFRRIHEAERQEQMRRRQMAQGYSVVRGPDGRLYRVPAEYNDEEGQTHLRNNSFPARRIPHNASPPAKLSKKTDPKQSFVRGPDGRLYLVQESDDEFMDEDNSVENEMETEPVKSSPKTSARNGVKVSANPSPKASNPHTEVNVRVSNSDMDMETESTTETSSSGTSTKNPRRRVTVIVEDVPESEDDDETKSFWRNRHPGPGESWMEPIV